MDKHQKILTQAERVFDRNGFAASGIDQITRAADVSSRTLYKHVGNKTGLICKVLDQRRSRFLAHLSTRSVVALFDALESWRATEGARGCLFLRAQAETGAHLPDLNAVVSAYRTALRDCIAACLRAELAKPPPEALVTQVQVLFEGATSAATYLGAPAVTAARDAAMALLAPYREPPPLSQDI